ncbi:MAG: ATP-binding protein [Oscillospiraceae bacterium]|nr:ATP-binding protein [Oscillospiraceae bacterium]
MTKDIVKNGDTYWFDGNGNSIVIAENGGVYFVDKSDKVRYLTDDIRKIYDEKSETYSINGMDIDEYIKSLSKPAQTTAVQTTATVKNTEPAIMSKPVQETTAMDTEIPARVIYQTIYNAPETEITFSETEKMEVSRIEKSEKTETEQQEISEVTTVPEEHVSEKHEAEEFHGSSSVHSQAAVTTVPQEKILNLSELSGHDTVSETSAEVTETMVISEVEDNSEIGSATNNAQAFLLLAGVFGAAIAAAVFMKKIKRKNISEDADLSELSARERDEIRLNKQKRKKPKKQKIKKKRVVPKTMQKTLPYKRVCDNYIYKVEENRYSKTYRFEDINYAIAKQEEQEGIFLGYCSVLNSFDTSADIQVTVHNNRVNKEKFNEMVLLKHKGDNFDKYVDSYNDMLVEKMEQGQNGIIRNKYLTVTVQAAYLEAAKSKFATIDLELTNAFKKIGSSITPMTSNERVELLKDIFRNVDEKFSPLTQSDFNRQAERAYCCPDYFEFKKDYFMWNDKYARTMFIKDMPASLKDCLLTDIANTNLDVMTTVNITPVDPAKALKIVNHQLTSMRANKLQAEKKAIQSGYTSDVINEELKYSLVEAEELLDDLRSKNQKMFMTNIVIMVTANDFDELENNTEAIEAVVRKHICSVSTLKFQQEKGLQSVLPIGNCTLEIRRTLTTESTAVFLPFSSKEISQENGMYYGLNALSNNLIIFNRLMLKNPNGFILGSPGSGKSFSAKREMVNVFLATDDDIIIIDPEREYSPLVKALCGEIINVSPASTNYINPLDMSQNYSDDENPLVMKSDFILSFFECLVGKQGLTAKERGIIDRCLTITYAEYMQDFDPAKIPTLIDFYEVLKSQPEKEAKGLALSFELYIKGNLNVFAHKTNVNTTNRVVCYDIKDLGKQLKTLGMLIVLDYVWNRITENRAKGKRTWIYMDEVYLLFANEYSANFLFELYKRARKWGGVPTGITQNVEDLLKSETARSMLSNTDFVMMLNQATSDRVQLARLLNISDNLLAYVTNSDSGQGLICCGGSVIPFRDKFPHNELYDLMTTKIDEVKNE